MNGREGGLRGLWGWDGWDDWGQMRFGLDII